MASEAFTTLAVVCASLTAIFLLGNAVMLHLWRCIWPIRAWERVGVVVLAAVYGWRAYTVHQSGLITQSGVLVQVAMSVVTGGVLAHLLLVLRKRGRR